MLNRRVHGGNKAFWGGLLRMDFEQVLAELRKELDAIDAAIISLERMCADPTSLARSLGVATKSATNGLDGEDDYS
jgi:hypothetical protein